MKEDARRTSPLSANELKFLGVNARADCFGVKVAADGLLVHENAHSLEHVGRMNRGAAALNLVAIHERRNTWPR